MINNILKILDMHNIPSNLIQNSTGNHDISCSCNLKSYIIKPEGDTFKLLESNLALNPKHKNKYHEVDKFFPDINLLINFIKSRNIYKFN